MPDAFKIDFNESWSYSDIAFNIGSETFYASKLILSMWSPVFEAMFNDSFKEKNAPVVELPGKDPDAFLSFIKVLHPPNEDICENNVCDILPLAQEYQVDKITERCEEFLLSQSSSIRNYLLALKYNLPKLHESTLEYLKRAPLKRLKQQKYFEELDQQFIIDLLIEKCTNLESRLDDLRDVRMVLERKKPTTFPGIHLLCESCAEARQQQVDCDGCMKSCCQKITEILRAIER